jgi:selenide,water dikinase
VDLAHVPLHPGVLALAREGHVTGASGRNWSSYGAEVARDDDVGDAELALLTDPQTSGGLLVACAPEAADAVLRIFHDEGFDRAAVIGRIEPASLPRARVRVRSGAR